jgi:flagellar M-ring protein FliF
VTSVAGAGRARVQLTTDFDLNRITETSDKFDPEGRVVRSSQTREEILGGGDGTGGTVSVGNELPGANTRQAETQQPREQNRKSEEIVNYEISRTTKTEVIEGGRVKRISVAVVVDGVYGKNDKGESTYQPRSKEEIDRIAALVRTAIGFDGKRGDQVEVANLRFAEAPVTPIGEPAGLMGFMGLLQFSKEDIMRAIELAVMALLGILVLLLGVRPLIRRIFTAEGAGGSLTLALPAMVGLPSAPVPALAANSAPPSTESVAIANRTSAMIDIAQVQGQVHAQSVQKVGELADRNPNETASIIRGWLHENAA